MFGKVGKDNTAPNHDFHFNPVACPFKPSGFDSVDYSYQFMRVESIVAVMGKVALGTDFADRQAVMAKATTLMQFGERYFAGIEVKLAVQNETPVFPVGVLCDRFRVPFEREPVSRDRGKLQLFEHHRAGCGRRLQSEKPGTYFFQCLGPPRPQIVFSANQMDLCGRIVVGLVFCRRFVCQFCLSERRARCPLVGLRQLSGQPRRGRLGI